MKVIDNKLRNLRQFQNSTTDLMFDEIASKEQDVLDLNRDEQLYQGVRADGSAITPPYKPITVQIKQRLGQPTDRVTLRDTGDFYDSFEIEFNQDDFQIVATDRKTAGLQSKYKNILGLNDSSIEQVIQIVKPRLLTEINKV